MVYDNNFHDYEKKAAEDAQIDEIIENLNNLNETVTNLESMMDDKEQDAFAKSAYTRAKGRKDVFMEEVKHSFNQAAHNMWANYPIDKIKASIKSGVGMFYTQDGILCWNAQDYSAVSVVLVQIIRTPIGGMPQFTSQAQQKLFYEIAQMVKQFPDEGRYTMVKDCLK